MKARIWIDLQRKLCNFPQLAAGTWVLVRGLEEECSPLATVHVD